MRVFFLDTSALVRLYVLESGWQWLRNLVRSATAEPPTVQLCFCDLALPEAFSALRQIAQKPDAAARGVSRAALRQTLPRVRSDLLGAAGFVAIPASACMPLAADLVERREIRGADAVHLAAALTARDTLAGSLPFTFVSHDAQQCEAAQREGLPVMTPG